MKGGETWTYRLWCGWVAVRPSGVVVDHGFNPFFESSTEAELTHWISIRESLILGKPKPSLSCSRSSETHQQKAPQASHRPVQSNHMKPEVFLGPTRTPTRDPENPGNETLRGVEKWAVNVLGRDWEEYGVLAKRVAMDAMEGGGDQGLGFCLLELVLMAVFIREGLLR